MKITVTFVLMLTCLFLWRVQQTIHAAEPSVTISTPARDGTSVGCDSVIAGTAEIGPGQHVWVFAARQNFANMGLMWPQGEAEVDPTTKKWSLTAVYGKGDDIGNSFRIAAAVFDDQAHAKLKSEFIKAMTTGKFMPMQLPETAGVPQYRVVKKINHDNCSQ